MAGFPFPAPLSLLFWSGKLVCVERHRSRCTNYTDRSCTSIVVPTDGPARCHDPLAAAVLPPPAARCHVGVDVPHKAEACLRDDKKQQLPGAHTTAPPVQRGLQQAPTCAASRELCSKSQTVQQDTNCAASQKLYKMLVDARHMYTTHNRTKKYT